MASLKGVHNVSEPTQELEAVEPFDEILRKTADEDGRGILKASINAKLYDTVHY